MSIVCCSGTIVCLTRLCGSMAFFFFFKQKTAYEIGLGIPAEPLFRSEPYDQYHENSHAKHWDYHKTPLIGRQPTCVFYKHSANPQIYTLSLHAARTRRRTC